MGRPPSFDRDEIVDRAMQQIWRDGYEASSVKALSERLGLTRSSFYNAFGSREDLFREVLAAYAAQSPDRVLREDPTPGVPIRTLLTATFREICRVRAADPDARGCMVVNTLSEHRAGVEGGAGAIVAEAVLASAARLESLLQAAVAKGDLAPDTDTRAAALALQAMLVGLNAMSKAVRSEHDLWLTARTLLQGLGLYDPAAA